MITWSPFRTINTPITQPITENYLGKSGYSPLSLFAKGEQGAWYDPSDTTTLFQDSAGTTPVTASGQPVGLMLDKSKGLVLGSERKSSTSIAVVGTPPAGASYDAETGAGTLTRTDASNQSYLTVNGLPASRLYRLDILNTSLNQLTIRQNSAAAVLHTVLPGARFIGYVSTQLYSDINIVASAAGATSVTVVSVRELPGNHATQPTAGSRPIYRRGDSRGVVNLLTWSEDFSNAAWTKATKTITANAATSPDGAVSADKLVEYITTENHSVYRVVNYTATAHSYSVRVKNAGRNFIWLRANHSSSSFSGAFFNLTTGEITGVANCTASVVALSNGWFECRIVYTPTTAVAGYVYVYIRDTPTSPAYLGDGTSGIYIWGAQLEVGSTALPYQRNDSHLGGVATGDSTDLHWLETDGVDDGMVTGSIDFTGTDKVSVFAGVRKLSDAAMGILAELSASIGQNPSSFYISAPGGVNAYGARIKAAAGIDYGFNSRTTPAPVSSVLSLKGDLTKSSLSDAVSFRLDGSAAGSVGSGSPTPVGNFGNYPLYLFRRGGASPSFNGWFYGLAITGRLTTDAETVATEKYLAGKTAVVIP